MASSEPSGLMPVALLEILSAGLKRKKKEVQKEQPGKRDSRNKKEKRNGSSPGSNRHFSLPVALGGDLFPANHFLPGALGRRRIARTGFGCRRFILLAPGGEFLQELLANLCPQRGGVLHNLWVAAG